jgi:hypothetical protein
MAEEKKSEGQASGTEQGGTASATSEQQTGDPGRTPGAAEGDRETVEQDLESRSKDSPAE